MVIDYEDPRPPVFTKEELKKELSAQTIWFASFLVIYHVVHEIALPLVAGSRPTIFFIFIPLIVYFSNQQKQKIVIGLSVLHLLGLCLSAWSLFFQGVSWSEISKLILLVSDAIFLFIIIKIPLWVSLIFLVLIFVFPAPEPNRDVGHTSPDEQHIFQARIIGQRLSAIESGLFCSEGRVVLYNPRPEAIFVRTLMAKNDKWQFQRISKLIQNQELNFSKYGFYQLRVHSGKFSRRILISIGDCVKEISPSNVLWSNNLLHR